MKKSFRSKIAIVMIFVITLTLSTSQYRYAVAETTSEADGQDENKTTESDKTSVEDINESESAEKTKDVPQETPSSKLGHVPVTYRTQVWASELEIGDKIMTGCIITNEFSDKHEVKNDNVECYIQDKDGGLEKIANLHNTMGSKQYKANQQLRVIEVGSEYGTGYIYFETFKIKDGKKKIKKGSGLNVSELEIGDVVASGTKFILTKEGITKFDIYLDECSEPRNDKPDEYTTLTQAMLINKEENGTKLSLYFETFYEKGEAMSEDSLKVLLETEGEATLAGDIALTERLSLTDGKEYSIDLNGYRLYREWKNDFNGSNSLENDGQVIYIGKETILSIRNTGDKTEGVIMDGRGKRGGAIRIDGGTCYISNVTFTENYSEYGGVFYAVEKSNLVLKDSVMDANGQSSPQYKTNGMMRRVWDGSGGCLYIKHGSTATIKECTIENNSSHEGGGIYCENSNLNISDSIIRNNVIHNEGDAAGLLLRIGSKVKLDSVTFDQNIGAKNGGGMHIYQSVVSMNKCTFTGNSAKQNGGAIRVDYISDKSKASDITISDNCVFENNTANYGAGIHYSANEATKMNISGASFINNISSESGGGMYLDSYAKIAMKNVTFSCNRAGKSGGGIYAEEEVSLDKCRFDHNASEKNGGAIYMKKKDMKIKDTTIECNSSGDKGGGIYVDSDGGQIILEGGKIIILDNMRVDTPDNITFETFKPLLIKGKLGTDSMIGITPPGKIVNLTKDYSDYNGDPIDSHFTVDSDDYRIDPDDALSEAKPKKLLRASSGGYRLDIEVRVTNDADDWDGAGCDIWTRAECGKGREARYWADYGIKQYLDESDDVYTKTLDCGTEFPSRINIYADFGGGLIFRRWEADVKIKVNGINVRNYHICRECWGNTKSSGVADNWIQIPTSRFPYPENIEADHRREVDPSKEDTSWITVNAVDQYGVAWDIGTNVSIGLKNLSFPENDTYGLIRYTSNKLKIPIYSNLGRNHPSTYELTYRYGPNLSLELKKKITLRFIFPLRVNVLLKHKDDLTEVLTASGFEGDTVKLEEFDLPVGYVIKSYSCTSGSGLLNKDAKTGNYSFTFVGDNVTVTASTNPISYSIGFMPNGDSETDSKDVSGTMSTRTAKYDNTFSIPTTHFKRAGYVQIGWNTKADGSGESFPVKSGKLKNLTTVKNDVILLYAIWQAEKTAGTTASLFSGGRMVVYFGSVIIIMFFAGGFVFSRKRKRKQVR
ncbi:hypothetical protein [Eubacterium xylanophilum]|uniref:hypothetical protein n=1 Tax=Eubacterium xylanophilum TaxID=39497 RepID=UPI00047EB0FD|nr:hypothetical protein [Eubacterium xylanophilum]